MFKKNDFVNHPRKLDWGIGIVTKDQTGDVVSVFFENTDAIIKLKTSTVTLEVVADPGQSRSFLENVLIGDDHKGITDRQPFPTKVAQFVDHFKGGLHGAVLEKHERRYKQDAHEEFVAQLNKADFERLMASEEWDKLAHRIKKCHSINLLSKFELIRFADVLKDLQAQKEIGQGLYDLLYGEDLLQSRFERYASILEGYECDKWPIITLPLFLRFPEEHMFIKPPMTQEAAANRGFDIQYDSQLNWNTYSQVLLFSKDLFERLSAYENPDLHPRDMIDVQTFMFCTFTKGWSIEEIKGAEAKIEAHSK